MKRRNFLRNIALGIAASLYSIICQAQLFGKIGDKTYDTSYIKGYIVSYWQDSTVRIRPIIMMEVRCSETIVCDSAINRNSFIGSGASTSCGVFYTDTTRTKYFIPDKTKKKDLGKEHKLEIGEHFGQMDDWIERPWIIIYY